MFSLREEQCYGLSSRKLSHGRNISVFHVKLTDSAATALGSFQNSKGLSSHPSIRFTGNQGRITIPCAERNGEERTFTFYSTKVAGDNPHGSLELIQHLNTRDREEQLCCVGAIQDKLTVNATEDSYSKARQSLAQAEEETRSRGAIVIKPGGRFQSKKVKLRAPAPGLGLGHAHPPRSGPKPAEGEAGAKASAGAAGLRKSKSVRALAKSGRLSVFKRGAAAAKPRSAPAEGRSAAGPAAEQRPLRERLTHLLALRPYRRAELVLRLQRDGLTAAERDALNPLLLEVGQLNAKDDTYMLKDFLYKELQKDWAGYNVGDQQLLKRILVRRLFQPHHNLLAVPETQVSPLRDTPNSSPAHPQKPFHPEEYTDPLANKKPRISLITSKAANENASATSSDKRDASKRAPVAAATDSNRKASSLDPRRLFDSLSEVTSKREEGSVARSPPEPSPSARERSRDAVPRPPSNGGSLPLPRSNGGSVPLPRSNAGRSPSSRPELSDQERHGRARKKRKHKHRDQEIVMDGTGVSSSDSLKGEVSSDCTEPNGMFYDPSVLQANNDMTDYLLKYTVICNREQRLSYKQDFNVEYQEYRCLHASIDGVTQQFMELDKQLKQLRHGSHKYKTLHNKILQDYRAIKKSNPDYSKDKLRCEYLHNKLAHIKKLISEYDQRQLNKE